MSKYFPEDFAFMAITVLWDMSPCIPADFNLCLGGYFKHTVVNACSETK